MNNVAAPILRVLLHARANHPTKSALLQSLLAQLPTHNVDMQSTIDIDESLQVVLNLAAHEPGVEAQLTNDLLEQYGFALCFDPTSTNAWQSKPDTNATMDFPALSHTTKPVDQQRSTPATPSLTNIINNSRSASVWIANDPVLDRQIVLKEYKHAANDPRMQTNSQVQFLREAQITGQLEHPNIIPVYAISWNKDGRPYYTMQHLDGDTLTERIDIYHLNHNYHTIRSLRPLLDIFANVCRGISYAHNRGVIHRDIKPSNIAIGSYGEVMVIDWGLGATPTTLSDSLSAKTSPTTTEPQEPSETLHGEYQGTPNYMSPEQAIGDTVTCLTDVYSLGGILYSILTGRPPRSDAFQPAPLAELLKAVVAEDIPAVDTLQPSVPIQLVAMVNKATHRDQQERYQNVTSLLNDLQAVMADESIAVCPDNMARATSRWIRKHPILVSIASTFLILGFISLSVSNFVIKESNDQARILLANSRILTGEAIALRNELAIEHGEEADARESASSSQAIAMRQRNTAAEQAELANSARSVAAMQLKLATLLALEAQKASIRAKKAKTEAYDALKKTDILKTKSQQLAQVIRGEHVNQLFTQAQHLIGLGRPREALLPLLTAITIPDRDADDNGTMLHLANSLMDRTVSLSNIELTKLFSSNLLASPHTNNFPDLQCVSLNPTNSAYQLLCLRPHNGQPHFTPVVRELPSIPIAILPIGGLDARVVVLPDGNSTSILLYPTDTAKTPISFTIGLQVTAAITSHNRNQVMLGTQAGGGFSFNLQTGTTKSILTDVGTPITELSLHTDSSIAAFATGSSVHIVIDPLDAATTISSFKLPDSVSAMHFNSTRSLVVVTSRGYVIEYPELPKPVRLTRFRPRTAGSSLRNVSVHPNGSILLDQTSNHLTLLSKELLPTTVQSPLTVSVRSMKFTSDGLSILTTTDRRISTVWECATMQPLVLPMQSGHLVIAMEFDSVDECLYTLHSDASLRTWTIPSDKSNVSVKHTATSTLERFKLLLSVQPSDEGLGLTAVQAKKLLASRLKRDE
jgi:serine/threonine protein kinase